VADSGAMLPALAVPPLLTDDNAVSCRRIDNFQVPCQALAAFGGPHFGSAQIVITAEMLFRERDNLSVQAHEHLRHVVEQILE
jgi:hypothetical protein